MADAIARLVDDGAGAGAGQGDGGRRRPGQRRALAAAGVAAIDVGGAGGTSFARIEGERPTRAGDGRGSRLGRTFAGWGIPTAASVLEVRGRGCPGRGHRRGAPGLDAARALALGARAVGLGRPRHRRRHAGRGALVAELGLLIEELRTALVLCGARRPGELAAPVLAAPRWSGAASGTCERV